MEFLTGHIKVGNYEISKIVDSLRCYVSGDDRIHWGENGEDELLNKILDKELVLPVMFVVNSIEYTFENNKLFFLISKNGIVDQECLTFSHYIITTDQNLLKITFYK